MTNTLTQTTLAPRAQLFTLALAVLVAPTTTAFSAVGTDYINDGTLMVPVGDVGNIPDPANNDYDDNPTTGFGGVPYGYSIGKYEVTNAQYALFLNSVDPTGANNLALYNTNMGSSVTYGGITYTSTANEGYKYTVRDGNDSAGVGWADKPVIYVSFWDAARFCNWLTNGGTKGADTETGVYTLDGGTAIPTNNDVTRNVEVNGSTLTGTGDLSGKSQTIYAVASEDEWYKAAYYSPNQGGQGEPGYWTYPTQSDSISTDDANYNKRDSTEEDLKAVGSYEGKGSYYGTFDQGGNVWEWNDTIFYYEEYYRLSRGGAYASEDNYFLASSNRYTYTPSIDSYNLGFRISSLLITSVPEPGTYGILGGAAALLGAVALRRRNRRD